MSDLRCPHGISLKFTCGQCDVDLGPKRGANQCEHGQLARSCDLCEKDAEIARLRAQLDEAMRDVERIDKMQEVFIKGEQVHVIMCDGHDMVACDHPTHPHFESFDWNWRCPPVRGTTLREVMDAAIDAHTNKRIVYERI